MPNPLYVRLLFWVIPALVVAYAILWAILLIQCYRRREFYPILGDSRRTRLLWLASFVFLNPVLTFLYILLGRRRLAASTPPPWGSLAILSAMGLVVVCGFFTTLPGFTHLWMTPFVGRGDGSESVKLRAAVIEAVDNTSTSSALNSSSNSRFACRRIAILPEGDQPLLRQIVRLARETLQATPFVAQVELFEPGTMPTSGQLAPDLFMRMGLAHVEESGLPYARSLQATVEVNTATSPWSGNVSYTDGHYSPRLIGIDHQMTIEHRSKTTGYESTQFALAAQDIAKTITDQLAKQFTEWRDKYGVMGEVPPALLGRYAPPELPETLQGLRPVLVYSAPGLMSNNDAYWRFELPADGVERMQTCARELSAQGWKGGEATTEPAVGGGARFHYLRATKGDKTIEVFRQNVRPAGGITIIDPTKPAPPVPYFIHYQDRFTEAQIAAAADALLSIPVPEYLIQFSQVLDRAPFRERFQSAVEGLPAKDPGLLIWMAERYQGEKESNKALVALRHARAVLWTEPERNYDYDGRIKDLVKKLGQKEQAGEFVPTSDDLRQAGYVDAAALAEPLEMEIGLDQPVRMLYCRDGNKIESLRLCVTASGLKGNPYHLKYLRRFEGGWSSGESPGWMDESQVWRAFYEGGTLRAPFRMEVRPLPGRPGRFVLKRAASPLASPAPASAASIG